MEIFHYPLGHVWAKTMTVGEIKARLADFADDLPVFVEWENQHIPVWADNFAVEVVGRGDVPAERRPGLVINAD